MVKWLGVKYSIFVNSGSSANLLSIKALKIFNKNKNKNEIIVRTDMDFRYCFSN